MIVGAGPAGLACAATLRMRGRISVVLEQAEHHASSWRAHYDRLHLHTHRMHSGLPGKPMPRDYPKYPSRLQVVDYLDDYARSNAIDIRCGTRVTSIRKDGTWRVETDNGAFEAETVIVATGYAHEPVRPDWTGRESFSGQLMHSSEFHNAKDLGAARVLVVGFGNSAGEIALECAEAGLFTGLSVRGPVNVIPRELLGIPILTVAIFQQYLPRRLVEAVNAPILRLRFGDISKYGLKKAKYGAMTSVVDHGQVPLIDIGTMARIRSGDIKVFGGISHLDGQSVHFDDGRSETFDAIVYATGYRPALEHLLPDCEARFGPNGIPPRDNLHPGGDGLYFCGFNVVPTGHLRQIGIESSKIAGMIAGR